jgi:enoyl-CoA hydratase
MEALAMGLVNRISEPGKALEVAMDLARTLLEFPQYCMRSDRQSLYEQWDLEFAAAMANEINLGISVLQSGETVAGAKHFVGGAGRHGIFGR